MNWSPNLVEAYRAVDRRRLDWMTDDARARARQARQVHAQDRLPGEVARLLDARDRRTDDLIGNVRATTAFEFHRELGKIGKPIDRDEWFATPQTINAYYNPGFNEIVFPAAILQYPFFDETRDAAANYGAIGAVIGHEIGHGFDDQGSQVRRRRSPHRLVDRRTTGAAFEERTSTLIAPVRRASSPRSCPDHQVNGALTIGENIGDLGGLGIAWKAYLISLEGAEPPVDRRPAPARSGSSSAGRRRGSIKARDEEVVRLLSIDPHSPNEFRCNQIVRNIDAFYRDVRRDPMRDALWLDPRTGSPFGRHSRAPRAPRCGSAPCTCAPAPGRGGAASFSGTFTRARRARRYERRPGVGDRVIDLDLGRAPRVDRRPDRAAHREHRQDPAAHRGVGAADRARVRRLSGSSTRPRGRWWATRDLAAPAGAVAPGRRSRDARRRDERQPRDQRAAAAGRALGGARPHRSPRPACARPCSISSATAAAPTTPRSCPVGSTAELSWLFGALARGEIVDCADQPARDGLALAQQRPVDGRECVRARPCCRTADRITARCS